MELKDNPGGKIFNEREFNRKGWSLERILEEIFLMRENSGGKIGAKRESWSKDY